MRNLTDLKESYNGDLVVEGGDLADTSANRAETYYQLIRTILSTPPRDSYLFPNMGFDASEYEGAVNNEATGKNLARAIKDALTLQTNLYPEEVSVMVFPVGKHTVAAKIVLIPFGESRYEYIVSYDTSDKMIRSFVFDANPSEPIVINKIAQPVKITKA